MLVISDTDKEFKKRIVEKRWPIFINTTNKKKLRAGDLAVIYKAGEGGQAFLGTAEVKSEFKQDSNHMDGYMNIDSFKVWKKPKKIIPILDKLDFIKNKTHWGIYMQGGVKEISEKDYLLMIKA